MIVTSIKTHKIAPNEDLFAILDKYITQLPDKSVVAITSKIVATAEGRVIKMEDADKDELIRRESQYFIPREKNKYNIMV